MSEYPNEIDLGGRTYAVEQVITPADVSGTARASLARQMRGQGVGAALVLADAVGLYVVPVEADGGIDPARLKRVGR